MSRLLFVPVIAILMMFASHAGAILASDFPLSGSRQIVLVIAGNDSVNKAHLELFSRSGVNKTWIAGESWPAVIGKNGLAWGRGLHDDTVRLETQPVKREGDGKSPEGIFSLPCSCGYMAADSVQTMLPYTQSTPDLICIDDVRSEFYNMIVNLAAKGVDPSNLPSHEEMLRDDNLYLFVITVGHNLNPPEKGLGSCIFLHIWRGPESYTAGCTAMSEENMIRLMNWLDPSQHPVLVQLTRADYLRLRTAWGLPER
jgi:L,D-peptidoglycan transpeptidase YkuD (ErfK/YbiS/YcfS/YnhG family)